MRARIRTGDQSFLVSQELQHLAFIETRTEWLDWVQERLALQQVGLGTGQIEDRPTDQLGVPPVVSGNGVPLDKQSTPYSSGQFGGVELAPSFALPDGAFPEAVLPDSVLPEETLTVPLPRKPWPD